MKRFLSKLSSHWFILIFVLSTTSCCVGGSSCNDPFPAFSVRFIKSNNNYHFFKDTTDVDIKIVYNDSIFLELYKQESLSGDSMLVQFFAYPNRNIYNYNMLAQDTLIGTIELEYEVVENRCCSNSTEVSNLIFVSDQKYSTQFGSIDIIIND